METRDILQHRLADLKRQYHDTAPGRKSEAQAIRQEITRIEALLAELPPEEAPPGPRPSAGSVPEIKTIERLLAQNRLKDTIEQGIMQIL